MKIKLLLLFLFLSLFPFKFIGNNCTTNAGNFASWAALTWTCTGSPAGGPPGCGDIMNIAAGTTVHITSSVDYSGCGAPIQLNIYGTMDFPTGGVRFKLPPGSTVFLASGGTIQASFTGGGSSTLISVGTDNVWTAGQGTITGPVVLPIELLSFTAAVKANSIKLDWSTASETNNDFFTIERSINGIYFQAIGTAPGAGTTTSQMSYTFEDTDPLEGISYYRLRQTDFDNHTATFNVIAVDFHNSADFSMSFFPNPNDGTSIYLQLNAGEQAHIALSIFDIVGRPVHTEDIVTGKKGDNLFKIEMGERLGAGIYSVSCVSGSKFHIRKLVVK